jgi:hypothetical protein
LLIAPFAATKDIVNLLCRSASATPARSWLVAGLLVVAASGCGRNEIRVYRVPREQPPRLFAADGESSGQRRERPPVHRLEWKLPKGWFEQPSGNMSVASFVATGPNGQLVSITAMPFPGMANQDLLVINILGEKSNLPPITEQELAQHTEQVAIGPASGRLFEPSDATGGSTSNRLLVAMVSHENVSWFFRMSGDTPLVAEQKPAFVEFLRTLTFLPGTPEPAAPSVAVGSGGPTKPAWTVPTGWQEVPPTTMLLAKFIASGESGTKAEITVSVFPGSTGGLLANVNRWRGQIGLSPVNEKELEKLATPLEHPEGRAMLVDMTGSDSRTGGKVRLIGAVMPHHDETWFYKLMGDENVATREKDAFVKFVQSVDYHAGSHR